MLEPSVKLAKRTQLNKYDEDNRMVGYMGCRIPTFGRIITPIESGERTVNTASFIVVNKLRTNWQLSWARILIGFNLHQQAFLILIMTPGTSK